MTEVTLAKRIIALLLLALVVASAAACTREKPPVTEPSPTGAVALQAGTPPPTTGDGVVLPTLAATAVITSAETSEAPGPIVLPPTLPPTSSQPIVLPSVAVSGTTEAPATPPASGSGTATTYTIQWGDLLVKIAQRFGVTTQAIMTANPGLDPNRIVPGQVINIPAGGTIPTAVAGTAGQPVPATTPAASGNVPGTYTVQRGEWFYSIARKFGISVAALQAANPSVDPNFVYPGQILNIPGGTTSEQVIPPPSTGGTSGSSGTSGSPGSYTVQQGDTLYSIAVRFGTTVYSLQMANHLSNPNFVYPGQTLVIP